MALLVVGGGPVIDSFEVPGRIDSFEAVDDDSFALALRAGVVGLLNCCCCCLALGDDSGELRMEANASAKSHEYQL